MADLSEETLRAARISARLERAIRVNLERALRHGRPLSGHFVLGHVDGILDASLRLRSRKLLDVPLLRAERDCPAFW